MQISIKKLIPDLAEEYVCFFDVTPHDNGGDENKCYCVTWRCDASFAHAGHWFPTREERRTRALQFVREGSIRGYLAYVDNRIVGWCNANDGDACRMGRDYLRAFYPIPDEDGARIKSVFCFCIAPEVQRRGVARQLLEFVCRDAAEEGYDIVEAYVNVDSDDVVRDFRGPRAMYEQCGFTPCGERDGKLVLRKAVQ